MFNLIKINDVSITEYLSLTLRPSSEKSMTLFVSDNKTIKKLLKRFKDKEEKISVLIYEDEEGKIPFASVTGYLTRELEIVSSIKGTELRFEVGGKISINS